MKFYEDPRPSEDIQLALMSKEELKLAQKKGQIPNNQTDMAKIQNPEEDIIFVDSYKE